MAVSMAACGSGAAARRTDTATTGGAGTSAAAKPQVAAPPAASAAVRLVRVASLREPVYITGAPGDPARLFVLERKGRVRLLLNGRTQARPFLDITGLVQSGGSEQGLLGLALAPDYARSGPFYVYYTVTGNDIRIVQYRRSAADPNVANPASARTVLTIDHRYYNHNGGQMAFGPDGKLYIGVGDGGSEGDPEGNGQSTRTLLAKLLRIDPSPGGGYSIPRGNPFVGQAGRRPEIWAYGLRNPWRFSFDRARGDLIIGDVGGGEQEEIDFAAAGTRAGANYGWSIWEGTRREKPGRTPGAIAPVLVARHSSGYCAIIGGYVVRDRSLPSLYGRYLFGDNCRPQIESVRLSGGRARGLRATGLIVGSTSSFGEDARGHLYITSLSGPVYRIARG
jgi:glucose/arabinose dehydrogenase